MLPKGHADADTISFTSEAFEQNPVVLPQPLITELLELETYPWEDKVNLVGLDYCPFPVRYWLLKREDSSSQSSCQHNVWFWTMY